MNIHEKVCPLETIITWCGILQSMRDKYNLHYEHENVCRFKAESWWKIEDVGWTKQSLL